MNWTGRVFLMTGAKRIGAAIATEAAARGADVALTYCHSSREALQTVNAVGGLGRRAIAIHADLREACACRRAVEETLHEFGRIDVLIAMASIYRATPFAQLNEEQWSESLSVDLSSSFHCALAADGILGLVVAADGPQ